jgi:hypothetical protein
MEIVYTQKTACLEPTPAARFHLREWFRSPRTARFSTGPRDPWESLTRNIPTAFPSLSPATRHFWQEYQETLRWCTEFIEVFLSHLTFSLRLPACAEASAGRRSIFRIRASTRFGITAGILIKKRGLQEKKNPKLKQIPGMPESDTPLRKKCRITWAALIKAVYEVDPLKCPKPVVSLPKPPALRTKRASDGGRRRQGKRQKYDRL